MPCMLSSFHKLPLFTSHHTIVYMCYLCEQVPKAYGLCFCVLQDELAKSVTMEQGKTFQDAKGDVFRGLGERQTSEVHVCSHARIHLVRAKVDSDVCFRHHQATLLVLKRKFQLQFV